jgi:hypothetical protein
MSGLDDTIRQMRRMGEQSGDVAKAMILAGAEGVKKAWRQAAEEHELRDTGDMIDSIGFPREPKQVGDVLTIDIYPQGTDRHGVRNAEKAFILHYGKHGYAPTYWVDDADAASAPKVQARLEAMWADYLETGVVPVIVDTARVKKITK